MTTNLENVDKKISQLQAQIQKLRARKQQAARKIETRKKILIGAYVLHLIENEKLSEDFLKDLDQFLVRNTDRALFNLPVRER